MEIAETLQISQKIIRKKIAADEIFAIKIDNSFKINEEEFLRLLNNKPAKIFNNKGSKYFGTDLFGEDHFRNNGKKKDIINWIDISDFWNETFSSDLTFIDLFSGSGGISKGFEMSGLNGICGLDFMESATKTYSKNFKHPIIFGDIKKKDVKNKLYQLIDLKLGKKPLNILAGGFPCQGFSISGNRIVDDPRNSLYLEMVKIVKKVKPDFVVMENVEGLRSMLRGKVESKIISDYEKIGYKVNVTILNAADYMVPQKRRRIIFICNRINKINYHPKPIIDSKNYRTTKDAIGDLVNVDDIVAFNHLKTKHSKEMSDRLASLKEGESLYKNYSDAWKKCVWNEPSSTIKENHGGVNVHPIEPRVLTAREMARLQSFPDDFIFEGTKSKQLVQIGNAVPPFLAKAIGLAIRKSYGEI